MDMIRHHAADVHGNTRVKGWDVLYDLVHDPADLRQTNGHGRDGTRAVFDGRRDGTEAVPYGGGNAPQNVLPAHLRADGDEIRAGFCVIV